MAFTRHIPNLTVMVPSDEKEMADMLLTALKLDGPSAIRYPRARGVGVPMDDGLRPLQVGKARTVVRGNDLLVIAAGSMVQPSVEASRLLSEEGFSAGVIDARFLKPLDRKLIAAKSADVGTILTVEEGVLAGGFGSAVLEVLAEEGLTGVRCHRMGIPDRFLEHGTRAELLDELGLTAKGIAREARAILEERPVSKLRRIL